MLKELKKKRLQMTVKEFLEKLNRYRVQYFGLQECLNKEKLTVAECLEINNQMNIVAENIARFVLSPQDDAEIAFENLLIIQKERNK